MYLLSNAALSSSVRWGHSAPQGCGRTVYRTKGLWRRRGGYSSMRKHLKGHSPAETAPKPNLISDVLRAAFIFRENARLNKLAKISALCAGLAVKHSGLTSALPLSSLLPSHADTYLYLYLRLALCYGTQMCFTLHGFFQKKKKQLVLAGVNTV